MLLDLVFFLGRYVCLAAGVGGIVDYHVISLADALLDCPLSSDKDRSARYLHLS